MLVGITGSFGTGKTTVASIFRKHGFKVVNVDKLYAKISKPNTEIYNKIKKEFGNSVIRKNKRIDRSKLKKIVFNDHKRLKRLNKITHPLIIKAAKKEIKSIKGATFKKSKINKKKELRIKGDDQANIVVDIPLLFEAKIETLFDKIIVVKCDKKEQLKRILKSKKYSKKEAEQILKSQMPLKEKIKKADFVVDNSNGISKTKRQIKRIIKKLYLNF